MRTILDDNVGPIFSEYNETYVSAEILNIIDNELVAILNGENE